MSALQIPKADQFSDWFFSWLLTNTESLVPLSEHENCFRIRSSFGSRDGQTGEVSKWAECSLVGVLQHGSQAIKKNLPRTVGLSFPDCYVGAFDCWFLAQLLLLPRTQREAQVTRTRYLHSSGIPG